MNRRRFVSNLFGAGSVAFSGGSLAAAQTKTPKPDLSVKRVLAMFNCHLDVGLIDTQAAVMNSSCLASDFTLASAFQQTAYAAEQVEIANSCCRPARMFTPDRSGPLRFTLPPLKATSSWLDCCWIIAGI